MIKLGFPFHGEEVSERREKDTEDGIYHRDTECAEMGEKFWNWGGGRMKRMLLEDAEGSKRTQRVELTTKTQSARRWEKNFRNWGEGLG
jgi:hypothetical protein